MLDRSSSCRAPAPRMPRGNCSISCSRCWKICRWRSRAATWTGDDDMMSALDELGDMIRKQQQLRDRTFRQGQDQRRQRGQRGQRGQQGQQGQDGQQGDQYGELKQDQQALRDQLKKLLEELKKRGLGQQANRPARPGPAGAGRSRFARPRRRRHGRCRRRAWRRQCRRRGRRSGPCAGSLAQGRAEPCADDAAADGHWSGSRPAGPQGQARAGQETDPLGRPLRGREYGDDQTLKVPGEIDVQRARRILEELRRRLGEAAAPAARTRLHRAAAEGFLVLFAACAGLTATSIITSTKRLFNER